MEAAKTVAEPFPVPELPLLIVIHVVSLVAVQEQTAGAITAMVAL